MARSANQINESPKGTAICKRTEGVGLVKKIAFLFLSCMLSATEYTGRVVGVSDGDTVKVLDTANTLHKVRLAGIDAPESKQAWGQRSKQCLSGLVFGKTVIVQTGKTDRYGREVGKILVDGQDANLSQVITGMAWWYREYSREQSQEDRKSYEAAEQSARAAKRGLWGDSELIAPWDWRKQARRK